MNLKQLSKQLTQILNEDTDTEVKHLKNELGQETYSILTELTEKGFKILFTLLDSESDSEDFYDDIIKAVSYADGTFEANIGEYYHDNELILGSFYTVTGTYYDDAHDEIYNDYADLYMYLLLNLDSKTTINDTEVTVKDYILDNYPNSELSKAILEG